MADDTDVLLKFYDQARTEMRHIEEQRATTTNMIIVIMSVIIGYTVQQKFSLSLIPLSLLIIGLGIYGVFITSKLYERHQLAQSRSEYWLKHIDKLHPKSNVLKLRAESDKEHNKKYAWSSKLHLNSLWISLHVIFIVIGIGMTILIFVQS
jgi:hypothetical protein